MTVTSLSSKTASSGNVGTTGGVSVLRPVSSGAAAWTLSSLCKALLILSRIAMVYRGSQLSGKMKLRFNLWKRGGCREFGARHGATRFRAEFGHYPHTPRLCSLPMIQNAFYLAIEMRARGWLSGVSEMQDVRSHLGPPLLVVASKATTWRFVIRVRESPLGHLLEYIWTVPKLHQPQPDGITYCSSSA